HAELVTSRKSLLSIPGSTVSEAEREKSMIRASGREHGRKGAKVRVEMLRGGQAAFGIVAASRVTPAAIRRPPSRVCVQRRVERTGSRLAGGNSLRARLGIRGSVASSNEVMRAYWRRATFGNQGPSGDLVDEKAVAMGAPALLRGGRIPRLGSQSRLSRPRLPGGYSTLASTRAQLVAPPRPSMHPSLLLAHMGGFFAASCFLPGIGARRTAMRTVEAAESGVEEPMEGLADEEEVDLPLVYPLQRPHPYPNHLINLAQQLSTQIKQNPLDSVFTLRQLHLVTQRIPRRLPLPQEPMPDSSTLRELRPEPWVWQLPATAAIDAIVEVLDDPVHRQHPRVAQELLPLAVTIALNSLHWDAAMFYEILPQVEPEARSRTWELLGAYQRQRRRVQEPEVQPVVMRRLSKRERVRGPEPDAAAWREAPKDVERTPTTAPLPPPGFFTKATPIPPPAPVSPRPPISIPTPSLESLIECLARHSNFRDETMSLAYGLSALRRKRRVWPTLTAARAAIGADRIDQASMSWADALRSMPHTSSGLSMHTQLRRVLFVLRNRMRREGGEFFAVPNHQTFAAVSHLAQALDAEWARLLETPQRDPRPAQQLINFFSAVPPPPPTRYFSPKSRRHQNAQDHARVFAMVREVFRRIMEDMLDRHIAISGHDVVVSQRDSSSKRERKLPLRAPQFNSLILFALRKMESPDLATRLLQCMRDYGFVPTDHTQTIVFSALASTQKVPLEQILAAAEQSPTTVPLLLKHRAQQSDFEDLYRIVFGLLPELDYNRTRSVRDVAQPPPPGRSLHLYATLLELVTRAGHVGLAERVFRNGRWAAELSRPDRDAMPPKGQGWVVPPSMYTIMLRLYAQQARRGRLLGRRHRDVPDPRSWVRGWGRRALTNFLLHEQRARMEENLGTSAAFFLDSSSPLRFLPSTNPSSSSRLQSILRSEAAAIVAIAELENASREPELRSLHDAMTSPYSLEALETLFPDAVEQQSKAVEAQTGETEVQRRLREHEVKMWRRRFRPAETAEAARGVARQQWSQRKHLEREYRREERPERRRGSRRSRTRETSPLLRPPHHASMAQTADVSVTKPAPSSPPGEVDDLKALLARSGPLDLDRSDVQKLARALADEGPSRAVALAVLARFLAPSPTSTTRSSVQDTVESLLSGSDSTELVQGLVTLSAVLQVAPQLAASLLAQDSLRSRLEDAVELVSRPVGKGKGKQDEETLALVELLSLAAGHAGMRGLVRKSAAVWLESLLGSPRENKPSGNLRCKAMAGCAVVKLRLGKDEASTTGLPTAPVPPDSTSSVWSLDDLAQLATRLAIAGVSTPPADPDDEVLLPSLESLAYLTLTPSPSIKATASDSAFLSAILGLVTRTKESSQSSPARDYAVATLLDHLTAFPPPLDAKSEAAQVERLKRFTSGGGGAANGQDSVRLETTSDVEARIARLVQRDPSPIPTVRHLCTSPSLQTRRLAARVLHSFVTPQKLRGQLLQAGAARLLLSLVRSIPTPFSPADDTPAVQGLAKLLITANPLLVFGPTASSPLLLEATTALTLPLGAPAVAYEGIGLLPRFESIMALTNIAALDPSLTETLARLKLRDRPDTLLLAAIEELLLSQNTMLRRAATELICNLVASDAGIDYFEPTSASSESDSSKPPSPRLHVLLALASSPDVPTRLAATGAFTSLVYSPKIVVALCSHAKWVEMLVALLEDDEPGVRHRVYEVWRVIGEMAGQLGDEKEKERVRKGLKEGKVREELERAAQREQVIELKEAVRAAVDTVRSAE
ncbi:Proteophosphoglycan 5, partial [Rhodotorula toruloides]